MPNLGMNDVDKKVVRRAIQRQYYPNEQCNFNILDLKKRNQGIKSIENQYIERIKTGVNSKSSFDISKMEKLRESLNI